MKTRETCRTCGIALETAGDVCLRCAKGEVASARRFVLRGLIVGLVMSVLVFMLIGLIQQGIAGLDPRMVNPNLDAIASLPMRGRLLWAGLAFTIPFGYYHRFGAVSLPFQEPTWAGGGYRTPTNSEFAAVMLVVLGVVTAPVVGPVHVVYRLGRAARLKRYIRENT